MLAEDFDIVEWNSRGVSMEKEFEILRRQLQQRQPTSLIFKQIDKLLELCSPVQFQADFIKHVAKPISDKIDRILLGKVSSRLLSRFDQVFQGEKYALEDELVNFFGQELTESSSNDTCDRYYMLKNGTFIHIKASEAMISEGTTGYSLWDASVVLLASLNSSNSFIKHLLHGKSVLELGSGTGLGGLAVAACSNPSRVLLTDIAPVHDTFTKPNIIRNNSSKDNIGSEILYWNDLVADPDAFSSKFNVILGCDLVYDPDVVVMLLDALKALFLSSTSSRITDAILFCTLRNPKTFDDFITALRHEPKLHVSIHDVNCDDVNIILPPLDSFKIIHITRQQEFKTINSNIFI